MTLDQLQRLYALDYRFHAFTKSMVVHADCFEWMTRIPQESVHAIVTDPPYGVKEYDPGQLEKRENGYGGIWCQFAHVYVPLIRAHMYHWFAAKMYHFVCVRHWVSGW